MSETGTGHYWTNVLLEARKSGCTLVVALKHNPDVEAEGKVVEFGAGTGIVGLKGNDPDELISYLLLDEIAAIGVLKGDDD